MTKLVLTLTLAALALIPGPVTLKKAQMVDVVMNEAGHVEGQLPDMPLHTIALQKPFEVDGFTLIAAEPVRYNVVIVEWYFWNEERVRLVTAHELGHVYLGHLGIKQDEEAAWAFAECYSTVGKKGCAAWKAYLKSAGK